MCLFATHNSLVKRLFKSVQILKLGFVFLGRCSVNVNIPFSHLLNGNNVYLTVFL